MAFRPRRSYTDADWQALNERLDQARPLYGTQWGMDPIWAGGATFPGVAAGAARRRRGGLVSGSSSPRPCPFGGQ